MGDLRTKRTYKLLKDSLLKLLSEQSFDNIKVNDICEVAMVHRTTFYSHFNDKYELLDYVINETEKDIVGEISMANIDSPRSFYTKLISNVLDYLESNKLFFRSIIQHNNSTGIFTVIHNYTIKQLKNLFEVQEQNGIKIDVPISVIAEFYSGAVTSTIIWWLQSNSKVTKKDLEKYIVNLVFENPLEI